MELTEFLLARLDEDEEAARVLLRPDERHPWGDRSLSPVAVERIPAEVRGYLGGNWGEHFARWDPARVLAEVDAKRRIVELHAVSVASVWVNPPDGPAHQEPERTCAICGWVPDACDTVKALAVPFADHPDYDEAWKP